MPKAKRPTRQDYLLTAIKQYNKVTNKSVYAITVDYDKASKHITFTINGEMASIDYPSNKEAFDNSRKRWRIIKALFTEVFGKAEEPTIEPEEEPTIEPEPEPTFEELLEKLKKSQAETQKKLNEERARLDEEAKKYTTSEMFDRFQNLTFRFNRKENTKIEEPEEDLCEVQEALNFFSITEEEEATITWKEVCKRKKKLAIKYHPDKNKGDDILMLKVNTYFDILEKAFTGTKKEYLPDLKKPTTLLEAFHLFGITKEEALSGQITLKAFQKIYKSYAVRYHPDKFNGNNTNMIAINTARDLINKKRRK
ncbi:hypothetical protein [Vibrio gallicus]|uniref:hypothetical protein n=1 Tax=Vibrio gallicus TaxID=190897 RepID=UPI0021C3FB93|nr:hypothetical protein [Vibrio gallicus]